MSQKNGFGRNHDFSHSRINSKIVMYLSYMNLIIEELIR